MDKNLIIDKVRQIQAGKSELLGELCVVCYFDIYKMAYKFCKNEADANDIVQDTFLELTRSIQDLRNPEYFYVWIHRIVKSKCIKMFRKSKYVAMDEETIRALFDIKESKVDHLPKEQIQNKEDQILMHMFVEELPEHYRTVIELVYFEQLSMQEVQEYLDIPLGTIKSRLHTGKKKLKAMIKEFEKQEGRKVHFYDVGSVGIASLFSWNSIKTIVQERILSASVSQVVTYAVITVSCATTTVLAVDAGTTIIQEQRTHTANTSIQPQQHEVPKQAIKEELPVSTFHTTYQGKEITTEKEAYFLFIDWMNESSEKTEAEKTAIQPLYEALQKENGLYWQLMQQKGYILE